MIDDLSSDKIGRRIFMKAGAFAAGGLFALPLISEAAPENTGSQPNVVFIISDQHRADGMGVSGSPLRTKDGKSPTPYLDALAADGILFTNTYCPSPLCAPSRAAMMTGTYPHTNSALTHKMDGHGSGYVRFPGVKAGLATMGDVFRGGGYRTACIGKTHIHGETVDSWDMGFDVRLLRFYTNFQNLYEKSHYANYANGEWNDRYREMAKYGKMAYKDIDPVRFADVPADLTPKKNDSHVKFLETLLEKEDQAFDSLVADESIKFIEDSVKDGKKFFIQVGFEKPHAPWTTHRRFMDKFDPASMPISKTAKDTVTNGIYPYAGGGMNRSEEEMRNSVAAYYACVNEMDYHAGRVIEACKRLGIYGNTIFVYTSDHGESLFDHGKTEKHCMFEGPVGIPFILTWTGKLQKGERSDRLVSGVDFLPTLAALSGLPIPKTVEGINVAAKETDDKDRVVFSEFYEPNKGVFPNDKSGLLPMRMARWRDWKCSYTHGVADQLYNRTDDPSELNNLVLSEKPLTSEQRLIYERMRLAILDNWTIDQFPLLPAKVLSEPDSAKISWETGGFKKFSIWRADNGTPMTAIKLGEVSGSSYADASAAVGKTYTYWVLAEVNFTRPFVDWRKMSRFGSKPVLTDNPPANMPASRRMTIVHTGKDRYDFPYVKVVDYENQPVPKKSKMD